MFSPIKTRIEDILNAPAQFIIPIYQREYNWGKEEALDLIDDLKDYQASDGEKLFLGNMIFGKSNDSQTSVIDGQQRLTTILLLLAACKKRAADLGAPELAQMIQTKMTFVDSATGETKGNRLIASESVRETFECITKNSWDGKFLPVIGKKQVKRQINRIRPIYDFFLAEVSQLNKESLGRFLRAVYDAFVIRIDIESEIDALSIFERTNARGMELAISDLLKNYLFQQKVDGIEDRWAQILDNSGGTILRVLKYFYVAKKGPVRKSQLYRKLKGYAAEVTAQNLTQELLAFSEFYRLAKTADDKSTQTFFENRKCAEIYSYKDRYQKINLNLQALKEFGITQFCPTAYAAIECLTKTGGAVKLADTKTLIRLFDSFEKYHFINNVMCERVGNEVEELYAETSLTYSQSNNFTQTTDTLINELKKKLASEEEFISKFIELAYSMEDLPTLCYIFDRFNNHGLDPGQRVTIYDPDRKLLRRNHSIEHFLPQKPEAALKVKDETLEVIDNIGNLLAVSFRTNSRLGNASPAKKIERLKGELAKDVQNLSYVKEFIEKYAVDAAAWDKKKIDKRAREMAENAYRAVWKIA